MLNQRPRDSGDGVLSTQTPPPSQTVNNTSFRNVESTAVAAQLRDLFPMLEKDHLVASRLIANLLKVRSLPPKKQRKM